MSSSSGIHDPYWYEATVGQEYLLKMLDDKSGIQSVTFQKTSSNTLDDVVIKLKNNKQRCVQVKHSRVDSSFTFSSLFSPQQDSLFAKLFFDWMNEDSFIKTDVILFTNRDLGDQDSNVEIGGNKVQVPSIKKCYEFLKENTSLVSDDEKINNFLTILRSILKETPDSKILEFIKQFEIQYSQMDLEDYKDKIQKTICNIFGCSPSGARAIHSRLDHALRKWATSSRGKSEEVDRNSVLKELSLIEDEQVGQHEIPPPSPFFESRQVFSFSVEEQIKSSELNYFFITGEAGSGKSSVVSYLCNRPIPAFDLRFHAFLPLQASGMILPLDSEKTVTPKVFWTDLIIQLKRLLKDSLSNYNLPILTSHLTWEQIRNYVLDTLERIAIEDDRYVSIVIDGIDHAARSQMSLTFLDTLPSPSKKISKIKIILVGQPSDSYPQYPIWLREKREDVFRFYIPAIEVKDIESLLLSRKDLKIGSEDILAAAVEIQSRVMGNTLSAVFAIEEIVNCSTVKEIEKCLIERRLTGNLANYYEEIWSKTVQKIPAHKETISSALALVFSTFKTRPSPDFFFEALGDLNITMVEWNNVFLNLGPLIIKDTLGYRVLHNDVRIFLIGFTNIHIETVHAVANKIALFLQNTSKFKLARQNDLVGLITRFGESRTLCELVNDEFVFEGFVLHKNESQIVDEVYKLFDTQINTEFNIENVINSLLISKTIQSVDVSMDTYEIPKASLKVYDGAFLKSECKVSPIDLWNLEIVQSLLKDCETLYNSNYSDRSASLFNRWIEKNNDLTFLEKFDSTEVFERWARGEDRDYDKKFTQLVKSIGYFSLCFNRWDLFEKALNLKKLDSKFIHANLVNGGVQAIKDNEKNDRKIIYLMNVVRTYYVDDFVSLIEKKIISGNVLLVKYLVRRYFKSEKKLPLKLLIALAFSETVLSLGNDFIDQVVKRDVLTELWNEDPISDPERYLCYLIVIYSIFEKNRPIQGIVEDILVITKYRNHEQETIKSLKQLMYLSGLVSRSLIKSSEQPGLYFDKRETLILLKHVFDISKSNFRSYIKDKHFIVEMCVEILGKGVENLSNETFEEIKSVLIAYLGDEKYYWVKKWLIKFLLKNNCKKAVNDDLSKVLEDNSFFWSMEPNDRTSFLDFIVQFEDGIQGINFTEIFKKNRLGLFHPSSHKDYTLVELEESLTKVLSNTPSKWKTIGLEALAVSSYYDSIGDNRMHWYIKKSIAVASIRCGPNDFLNFLNATVNGERVFQYNEQLIVEIISESLKHIELQETDLIFLWEYCRSILPYGESDTTEKLSNLKAGFLYVANLKQYKILIEHFKNDSWINYLEISSDENLWFNKITLSSEVAELFDYDLVLDEVMTYSSSNSEYDTGVRDRFRDNFRKLLVEINKKSKKERDHLILKLQKAMLNIRQRYSFKNSGLSDLFDRLTDEMTLEELQEYYIVYFRHFINSEQLSFWADVLRDDLKTFLFAFMKKIDVDELVVRSLIQNSWHLVDSFENKVIKNIEVNLSDANISNWSDFYNKVIDKLLSCSLADIQSEAWKSLTRTMFMFPDLFKVYVLDWSILSDEVKVKVLGLLEVSKWSNENFYNNYSLDILSLACRDSESIEIRSAASLSMKKNFEDNTDFKFKYLKHEKFNNLPKGPDKLLDIESRKLGLSLFTNEYSTFSTKLKMAKLVIDDLDTAIVEKKVARLRINNNKTLDEFCTRGYNSIDLIKNDNLQLLHEAVEDEIASSRASAITTAAFFQFLLNGDDPNFLVLNEKFTKISLGIDSLGSYESMDVLEKSKFHNKIEDHMNSFLEKDEVVLSSTINLFSDKFDYIIRYDLGLNYRGKDRGYFKRISMFGGRGGYLLSSFHVDERVENKNILVCEYGGLFKFQKFNFLTYPKKSFVEKLLLKPMQGNPFILFNEKTGARISFQRINLHSKEKTRSPYYRMAYIDQWVINEQCKNLILKDYKMELKGYFRVECGEFEN